VTGALDRSDTFSIGSPFPPPTFFWPPGTLFNRRTYEDRRLNFRMIHAFFRPPLSDSDVPPLRRMNAPPNPIACFVFGGVPLQVLPACEAVRLRQNLNTAFRSVTLRLAKVPGQGQALLAWSSSFLPVLSAGRDASQLRNRYPALVQPYPTCPSSIGVSKSTPFKSGFSTSCRPPIQKKAEVRSPSDLLASDGGRSGFVEPVPPSFNDSSSPVPLFIPFVKRQFLPVRRSPAPRPTPTNSPPKRSSIPQLVFKRIPNPIPISPFVTIVVLVVLLSWSSKPINGRPMGWLYGPPHVGLSEVSWGPS